MSEQQVLNRELAVLIPADGARIFGAGPRPIPPIGDYLWNITDAGWTRTKNETDHLFCLDVESVAPAGFTGLKERYQVYVMDEVARSGFREVQGMSDDAKKNLEIARDKFYTIGLAVGYTHDHLVQKGVPASAGGIANAPGIPVTGDDGKTVIAKRMIAMRITHKEALVENPRTNTPVLLKNKKPAKRADYELAALVPLDYGKGGVPDRNILSDVQKSVKAYNEEGNRGVASAETTAEEPEGSYEPGSFDEAAGDATTSAPVRVPQGTAQGGEKPPAGFGAFPANGGGVSAPVGGAPKKKGLGNALPPSSGNPFASKS